MRHNRSVACYRTILLLACVPLFGEQYTISTFAGDSPAGSYLNNPTSLAVDSAGNVYVGDWSGFIRKIWIRDGGITVVAGTGSLGYSGDGGLATEALFWDPIPSAVNRAGDIYIADFENSRIRIVRASRGIVTTLAGSGACVTPAPPMNVSVCQGGFSGDGGPARNAMLNHAAAAALDLAGNLYIADTINHRIRRVDASTGLIYTIAGNGMSGFSGDRGPALDAEMTFPSAIAVDRSGRVYFADQSNNRIRVLTPGASQLNQFRQSPRR